VSDASIEADGIAAFTSVVCSPDVLDTGEGLPHPMSTARDRPPEEAAEDTSFARGLRVLLTIADRGEIRVDELSGLLETPVSTIYRYLRTLTEFGFVDRTASGYRLGPRLVIGRGTNVSSEELIRVADPVLQSLATETGETAVITRRIGLAAVCLHEAQSPQPLRVNLAPGTSIPLHRGAFAKVLLAYAPPDILEEFLAQEPKGPDGPEPKELNKELAAIVAAGVARSEGEFIAGTVTIAVPIIREDGIVAAIGVIGPDERCGFTWRERTGRILPGAAAAIVGSLGAVAQPA
jgi:DNA-binding IclR family transcriptional regulator